MVSTMSAAVRSGDRSPVVTDASLGVGVAVGLLAAGFAVEAVGHYRTERLVEGKIDRMAHRLLASRQPVELAAKRVRRSSPL